MTVDESRIEPICLPDGKFQNRREIYQHSRDLSIQFLTKRGPSPLLIFIDPSNGGPCFSTMVIIYHVNDKGYTLCDIYTKTLYDLTTGFAVFMNREYFQSCGKLYVFVNRQRGFINGGFQDIPPSVRDDMWRLFRMFRKIEWTLKPIGPVNQRRIKQHTVRKMREVYDRLLGVLDGIDIQQPVVYLVEEEEEGEDRRSALFNRRRACRYMVEYRSHQAHQAHKAHQTHQTHQTRHG